MSIASKILLVSAVAGLLITFSFAGCPLDEVIVKGRIVNAPPDAVVRVQLVYARQQVGDSTEVKLDKDTFAIKVPFYTQSRAPVINGNLFEKCNRKPKTVIVSLIGGAREYDRVSLDMAKDFTTPYPSAYILRSEIVLHGPSTP